VKSSAIIFFILLALPFRAAVADLLDECQGQAWPNIQLRACTDIIRNPNFGLDAKALAYQFCGNIRNNAGAFNQAIDDFNESIRLEADGAPAFEGRARAKFSLRNFAGALNDYDEAIRLSPANANLYIERGHVYLSLGNVDASIHDLTEAIKLNPRSAVAFNNRGLALRKKGDLDRAFQDYSAAIAIDSAYALAYANRGYLQAARGQRKAAISDLQRALLLDPSLVDAGDALRRLGGLSSIAREVDRRVREGHALAQRKCSPCHAIGAGGRSANAKAPEFRSLSRRYAYLALREPIARAVVAQHDQMPQFQLSDYQINTIVAYVNSLSPDR
jgi:tetratricopeptide (TPR) repeat protein